MTCPESHGDKDCQLTEGHETKHLHEYDSPPGGRVRVEWGEGESNYPEDA